MTVLVVLIAVAFSSIFLQFTECAANHVEGFALIAPLRTVGTVQPGVDGLSEVCWNGDGTLVVEVNDTGDELLTESCLGLIAKEVFLYDALCLKIGIETFNLRISLGKAIELHCCHDG